MEHPKEPGGNHVFHAVLELKVFRSLNSKGNDVPAASVITAVSEGLDQAIAYKNARQVKFAFLCGYDLRKEDTGDDCFNHETRRAERYHVLMRRWYVYNSSKAWRKAHYSS